VLFNRGRTITFDAALRDLASPDVRARVSAADALGDVPDGEDRAAAARALASALKDPRFEVRRSAVLALGELAPHTPVEAVVALLDDDHPQVRQSAAIALGRLGDERGFEPLARALEEGPADLRFQAAPSLVEIDAERAYQPLVAAIKDGDPEVRASVACALGFIGDRRAAGSIAELLDDGFADARFEAALALARLGDPRGAGQLIGWLEKELDRAYPAIEALESLKEATAAGALARLVRKLLAPRQLRVRAAGALLMVAPDGPDAAFARAFLERNARSRRPEVRGLAEEALARLA
jgi:HEAT repeat protein